jgi:hypothetical protein
MIAPWLSVLTTPSRRQYLQGTLDSLARASGGGLFRGHRLLFVDGDAKQIEAPPGWTTIGIGDGAQPRGSRRSVWRILHMAALAAVPYLLFFEDDVRACRNAAIAMAAIPVPDGCAFLTFCNQKKGLPPAPPAIYCRRADDPANKPGHWGNQALKVPAHSLRRFAAPSTEPRDQYAYASDVWLGEQLAASSTADHHYGIVVPSLVRHIGAVTTIPSQLGMGLEGHRSGLNYPGDDFDALAISSRLPVFGL